MGGGGGDLCERKSKIPIVCLRVVVAGVVLSWIFVCPSLHLIACHPAVCVRVRGDLYGNEYAKEKKQQKLSVSNCIFHLLFPSPNVKKKNHTYKYNKKAKQKLTK